MTYGVKIELDDDEDDENSNMDSECGSEDGSDQNLVADVDPSISVIEDEDSDEEIPLDSQIVNREYEPSWMNNGNEDKEVETISQWICQYCNTNFPSEEKFNRHALIHTSVILKISNAKY